MNTVTTNPTPTPRLIRSELKVLVVDDDLLMLDMISEALRSLGITQVTQASSGQQALDILGKRQQIFDLLLLDLHMPSMDGFAFMESIAQGVYKGALIIVSGQRDVVVQAASLVARLSQFTLLGALQKPFRKDALAALISKLA
jgi:CheY-like chemotaxis protein